MWKRSSRNLPEWSYELLRPADGSPSPLLSLGNRLYQNREDQNGYLQSWGIELPCHRIEKGKSASPCRHQTINHFSTPQLARRRVDSVPDPLSVWSKRERNAMERGDSDTMSYRIVMFNAERSRSYTSFTSPADALGCAKNMIF